MPARNSAFADRKTRRPSALSLGISRTAEPRLPQDRSSTMRFRNKLLPIAGAIGFALMATSAGAQDYYIGPPEEVIVTPPPYAAPRGHLGGPIQDVALSRPVRFDDLDLTSRWGAYRLRARIAFEARTLC